MNWGIRWRLLSIMLSLIMAVLFTLTYVQIWSQQHILEKGLVDHELLLRENNLQHGQVVSNNFSNQIAIKIAAFNFSAISELVRTVIKNNEDLVYVILVNKEQKAYVHTLKPELELEFLNGTEDLFALKQSNPTLQRLEHDGDEIIEFIRPIQISTEPWGVLRLGFSMAKVVEKIANSRQELNEQIQLIIIKSVIMAIGFLIIGFIAVFMISARISKPLIELTVSARKLSTGDFSTKINTIQCGGEIGVLATAFTDMAKNLELSYEQLEKYNLFLEQEVEERTIELKRKNALIRQVFGRYITDEIVDTLLETESGLAIGGERREITMLTSDLRGFTAQANVLPSEQVIKILNLYLGVMADVITEYNGIINQFLGDGILVFFGAPINRDDDPERAVACAIAMQQAMKEVNDELISWEVAPLEMGIGINTGEVIVGNVGSEKRSNYSAIGNNVNLTYRIESYTIGGQIFISEATLNQVKDIVKIWSKRTVKPKGIKQKIDVYEIESITGKYNLSLNKEQEIFKKLTKKIALKYAIVEEKHIDTKENDGKVVKLSANGAVISCKTDQAFLPKLLSNLKLNILDLSNEDIYAKVLNQYPNDNCICIHFTSIPLNTKTKLLSIYNSL
ncbi:adenylate/guanylate cyclase domain-containing protein [Candidatus Halobeggiatoa sp. HSG11]|nr:adenylate/guanylate cyclase domain-containing protein [Candidatus Halobeggiatoa sp. HSG11]